GAACPPPASPAAAAPAPRAAAAAKARVIRFDNIPPPRQPLASPRLHDRCLPPLLQRFLAALDQGMDRMARRRRLRAQTEEKFCLRQRRLGIAVAIQLQ